MGTDDNYPVEPFEEKRAEFEALAKTSAVEVFGYSAKDALLKTIFERNRNGRYAIEWVRGAWIGYVMAHQQLQKQNG